MKRILLVYAVNHSIQNPLGGVAAPSGLSWISKALFKNGFDSKICDLSILKNKNEIPVLIKKNVNEFKPHAIGISIRNIDTSVNPPKTFFPFLEYISSVIKHETDAPMILGGPGFSLYSPECMRRMKADYGVVGEGEIAFPELLKAIFSNQHIPEIPGVIESFNGTLLKHPRKIFNEFNDFGKARHTDIDYDTYEKIGGHYPIQTKRGCSFNCVYCDYPYLEGKKYRKRNPKNIVDEMEELTKENRLNHFFFTDSVFNFPHDHCSEILKEIVSRKLDINWTAYVNPNGLTMDLVELFKESGCSRVEVTTDTFAEKTLKTYQKHFTTHDIKKGDTYFKAFDIPTFYWANLGGPGETEDTMKENLQHMHELKQVTKAWAGCGFVVLPGSPLYEIAKNEGRIEESGPRKPYLYMSRRLPENFAELIQEFCIEHPAWFSVYDMHDTDYRSMAHEIIKNKIRDHWPRQVEYGLTRKKKYDNGQLKIYSHTEFQEKIIKIKNLKN